MTAPSCQAHQAFEDPCQLLGKFGGGTTQSNLELRHRVVEGDVDRVLEELLKWSTPALESFTKLRQETANFKGAMWSEDL